MHRLARRLAIALLLVGAVWHSAVKPASAQTGPSELRIFGYFQPQFFWRNEARDTEEDRNSFLLQQMNLFFQKDLGRNLTSFVNFEFVNSFSTFDNVGDFRIEEAWVRYRRSNLLNIKVGLQIPVFNHFNEIKNRMPVIPYIIRPLVYETSITEDINGQVYVPQQAFVQAYGWLPLGRLKVDYATYLGNTEVLNTNITAEFTGQTGVDTTDAVLFGGRLGIRAGEFKTGISASVDRTTLFRELNLLSGREIEGADVAPRYRTGVDISYYYRGFGLEAEWINVRFNEPLSLDLDLNFYYGTLSYRINQRFLVYAGMWYLREKSVTDEPIRAGFIGRPTVITIDDLFEAEIPNLGIAYILEDQITLKAAYAPATLDLNDSRQENPNFDYYSIAVTVSF